MEGWETCEVWNLCAENEHEKCMADLKLLGENRQERD